MEAAMIRDVPIPDRMKHLKRDPRGYPVFYGAHVDSTGKAHFTVNDERKRIAMIEFDLCSICGKQLLRGRWFCGGPMSAFHAHGAYIDMPMHDECLHYALVVCPYLAMPSWRNLSDKMIDRIPDGIVAIDQTMIDKRPEVFVAVMATGQRMVGDGLQRYVRPRKPYLKVEYWQHGRQLDDAEGEWIAAKEMAGEVEVDRALKLVRSRKAVR
jgi:hypothetical protein